MRVDVVDLLRRHPGIRERIAHAADDRLAVGARAGAVERVGKLAASGDHAQDLRAARGSGFEALQHQRAGAFGHYEPVAVLRKRLRGLMRRIVLRRQRRQQREAHQCLDVDRGVGGDTERGTGLAAADRLDAELNGADAGGARGRDRDWRAFCADICPQAGRLPNRTGNGDGHPCTCRRRSASASRHNRSMWSCRGRRRVRRAAASRSRPARPQETAVRESSRASRCPIVRRPPRPPRRQNDPKAPSPNCALSEGSQWSQPSSSSARRSENA